MAESGPSKQFECKRCGKCCQCGTIWTGSEHPIIKALFRAWPSGHFSDDGQCDMLTVADDGKPACLLELHLGKEHKPEVCNRFPFEPDDCHAAKKPTTYSL